MSYSKGPYGLVGGLPPPPASKLSSSRAIDFATKQYIRSAEGGFEPMSSTAQRVLLLCMFAGGTNPPFVTPSGLNQVRDRIAKALSILTVPPSPQVELLDVTATRLRAGQARWFVRFRDLTTGLDQTVQL